MQPEIAPLEKERNSDCKITLYKKISCSSWNFSQDIKKLIGIYNFTKSFFCIAIFNNNDLVLVFQKLKSWNKISPLAYFPLRILHATWNCPSRKTNEFRLQKKPKYTISCHSWNFEPDIKKMNQNQQFHEKLVLRCYF